MANRALNSPVKTMHAKVVKIFAAVKFGATGAPTLDTVNSRGVVSVARNAAGKFTFVFGSKVNGRTVIDPYVQCAAVDVIFDTSALNAGAGGIAAAPTAQIYNDATGSGSSGSIQIGLTSVGTTPALADPANGEYGLFEFTFIDTKAG